MTLWLRRQRYLADYTLAALGRRGGKNLALLAIYATVIFVIASAMLFATALRREATLVLAHAPELTVQRLVMGRHDLIPATDIPTLAAIRGVAEAKGRLWGYFYDSINGANYTIMVPDDPAIRLERGQAMIGEGVRRSREMLWDTAPLLLSRRPGDSVRFNVVGSLPAESALVSSDLVLIPEADFRAFFGLPEGVYTDIALRVKNEREVGTIIDKAAAALPAARFITRAEVARTYQKIFDWREGLMVALAGAAVLAFAIFAAEKASGLSAEESREIGVLKAIGWDTPDIIAMKLWEGGLISLTAFVIGVLAAYVHVFVLGAPLFAPVLKGWAVIYPDFRLAPQIDGLQMAALFLLTVLPYTAATLVPIWRVASGDPDQVMR